MERDFVQTKEAYRNLVTLEVREGSGPSASRASLGTFDAVNEEDIERLAREEDEAGSRQQTHAKS